MIKLTLYLDDGEVRVLRRAVLAERALAVARRDEPGAVPLEGRAMRIRAAEDAQALYEKLKEL